MIRSNPDNYNKKESFRSSTKFFLIYEGTTKELKYFEFFNRAFLDLKNACIIHVLEKDTNIIGSQPKKLKERAKSFIENPPKNLTVTPSVQDKFRFILDVDNHPADQFPELNEYCQSFEDASLFISNFCFEVWLWFHLEDQEKINSKTSDEIKSELGIKHTEHKINNYPKGYLTIERISKAIERSKQADINKDDYFPVEKSTKVYLLIEELLNYSFINNQVIEPKKII